MNTPATDGAAQGEAALAVVIPHYNDVDRLNRCLSALLADEAAPWAEIVVIDNGSSMSLDGPKAAFPGVRFITEPRKGAAEARNRGVAETTAPLVAFLDSDCLPASDWLTVARRRGEDRSADLWGGRIDVFDETPPPRSGAEAFEAVFAFDWRSYIEDKGFSVTANLVTRREVILSAGPQVNGLSEDMEWCRRATSKGWRLAAAPDLQVGHPSRADWPALERKWRRMTRENFALDGAAARLAWAIRALAMPVSAVVHLPRVIASPKLHGAGERLRGAATLLRLRLTRMVWMLRQAAGGSI